MVETNKAMGKRVLLKVTGDLQLRTTECYKLLILFFLFFNVYLTMLSISMGHKDVERYRVHPNTKKSLVCESHPIGDSQCPV